MQAADLAARLRGEGYRVTEARTRVFEALAATDEHLTADQLADRLAGPADGTGVTLSSVYRALAVLEELGLARASRLSDDDASHWELAHPDEHFHVVCRGCGQVDHHRGTLVSVIDEHLRAGHGFAPDEITVLARGLCAGCQP